MDASVGAGRPAVKTKLPHGVPRVAFRAAARYNGDEMKQTLTRAAIAFAVVLAFASCASLQRMSDERGAAWVAAAVNAGDAAALAAASASPFLLDGEIVALPEDTAAFWAGVVKAGVKFAPDLVRAVEIGAETWREFASTRDVRLFFEKHVADGARLFELPTADGRRALVLYRASWGRHSLFGFKGPY